MKEVTKEIKNYKKVYVAGDGKEFDDKEECKKYESTCNYVIRKGYNDHVVGTASEYEMYDYLGSEEYYFDFVFIEDANARDDVNKALIAFNGSSNKDNTRLIPVNGIGQTLIVRRDYDNVLNYWEDGDSIGKIINNIEKHMHAVFKSRTKKETDTDND